MENKKIILQKSIDTYGKSAIVDLFFEESAELTKALTKARRYGTNHKRIAAIVDEIADVTICLDYLKMIFNCKNAVSKRIDFKVDRIVYRTAQRIAELNSRQNCQHSCGTERLYCVKLTRDVEPNECCFQYSEKSQHCEALEKLRKQFVTR